MNRSLSTYFIFAGVLFLLTGCPAPPGVNERTKEAEVKYGVHQIQLAVEQYYSKNNQYPASIPALGPSLQMPENPFAGRPMREVPAGGSATPGDFTYLTQTAAKDPGKITGYLMLGYVSAAQTGEDDKRRADLFKDFPNSASVDWTHVAVALDSGL